MGKEGSPFYTSVERKPERSVNVDFYEPIINNDQSLSAKYIVSVSKQHFGFFSINDKGPVNLTWRGKFDMGNVEESVSDLSKIILGKELEIINPKLEVKATFDFSTPDECKYDLRDRLDYEAYSERLSRRDSFDNLRFAVRDSEQDKFFIFHPRNVREPDKIGLGIAFRSKSDFFAADNLAAWVMRHHWFGERFQSKGVMPADIFSKIKEVTG